MPIGQVTTVYPAVAHGALNWDTQLKADITAMAAQGNALAGAQTFPTYAGTVKDYAASQVSIIARGGGLVAATLNFDPGANTLAASGLAGTIPAGFRPVTNTVVRAPIANGGAFNGKYCDLQIGSDGRIVVLYTTDTILSGWLVAASVAYWAG